MKYPLLLRQVLKFSNANNEFAADMTILESAIENLENVLKDVDNAMAQARANFTVSRLEWLDEGVEARSSSIVANAEEEIISGTLRNNRGTVKNYITNFLSLKREINCLYLLIMCVCFVCFRNWNVIY